MEDWIPKLLLLKPKLFAGVVESVKRGCDVCMRPPNVPEPNAHLRKIHRAAQRREGKVRVLSGERRAITQISQPMHVQLELKLKLIRWNNLSMWRQVKPKWTS